MRIQKLGVIGIALISLLGILGSLAAEDHPPVPYPSGYRGWTFLHATIVGPQHPMFAQRKCEAPCTGGVFYFYANDEAMKGLKTGKFADGSILMDETLELHGADGGGSNEGPRRGVGVMVKDSKVYAATGGWGFGRFSGDSQEEVSTTAEKKACFQCHVPKKDNDYVFTVYRER